MNERTIARKLAVEKTVADVRAIERTEGVSRESLDRIKQRLMRLAAQQELFTASDYPPPEPGSKRNSCLYRISEDPDRRFALYVNSSMGNYSTPAHNHTTWAVIVGVSGEELNRFYDRVETGVREKGSAIVRQGTGVAFMPDDLHSIHISAPLINFHMYGLALEALDHREYYKAEERVWKVFPPHSDIREARSAR